MWCGVSLRNPPRRCFNTGNYVVCGLRPYGEKIVILSYPEIGEGDEDAGTLSEDHQRQVQEKLGVRLRAGEAPEVRIIDFSGSEPLEASTDVLSMRGYENCSWQDYSLDHLEDQDG